MTLSSTLVEPAVLALETASTAVLDGLVAPSPVTSGSVAAGPLATKTAAGPSTLEAAVVTLLVLVGTFFLVVGTVGLLRLPNVFNRMHATSKATTLGAASLLLAAAVYFGPEAEPALPGSGLIPGGYGLVSLVCILFLFATAPTGAHVISRSGQKMGISFVGLATWPAPADEVSAESEGEDRGSSDEETGSTTGGPSDPADDDSTSSGDPTDEGVTETSVDDPAADGGGDEDADDGDGGEEGENVDQTGADGDGGEDDDPPVED